MVKDSEPLDANYNPPPVDYRVLQAILPGVDSSFKYTFWFNRNTSDFRGTLLDKDKRFKLHVANADTFRRVLEFMLHDWRTFKDFHMGED